MSPRSRVSRVVAALAVGAVMTALSSCSVLGGATQKHFSADFTRAIGVYKHSDVRILGVKIGEVTKVTPEGTKVRLDMTYDASYKIPADAAAVLVAPSIVSDRYVQLTPVWAGGDLLPDGAHLGPWSRPAGV